MTQTLIPYVSVPGAVCHKRTHPLHGRPADRPAPPNDRYINIKLRCLASARSVAAMSEEHLLEITGLTDFQRRLLALPLDVQLGLSEADDDELVAVAQKRGYLLGSPAA